MYKLYSDEEEEDDSEPMAQLAELREFFVAVTALAGGIAPMFPRYTTVGFRYRASSSGLILPAAVAMVCRRRTFMASF